MFTMDFINQYARNMYRALQEGRNDLNELNFECEFCPLRAECTSDPVSEGCTSYLLRVLRDGNEFMTVLD